MTAGTTASSAAGTRTAQIAGTLIVGASHAGVELAATLRSSGHKGPVTLVGAEAHPPYQRPPLSKTFLAGQAEIDSLALRSPRFYSQRQITTLVGERVVRIDMSGQPPDGAGVAVTDRGRRLRFNQLALTVGSRPRRLAVPGADLDGVCYLRELDDARRIRQLLPGADRVVVIGGGFIGLEVAATATAQGRSVVVVDALDRLMSRTVAPPMSEFFLRAHQRRGTGFRLQETVSRIAGRDGRVTGVVLAGGELLPADLVVIGIGVVPRTALARQLGLHCQPGIVVDRHARTSNPAVVAAGDCTVVTNPITGHGMVSVESMPHAASQARSAAASLLGQPAGQVDIPWFWSDQADLKLQIAGLWQGYDRYVVRGRPESERFSTLFYRAGQLIAVTAVNQPADYLAARHALARGRSLPPEPASDPSVPLKDLLQPPATGQAGTPARGQPSAGPAG